MIAPPMRRLMLFLAPGVAALILILWILAVNLAVPLSVRSCPVPDAAGHIPQVAWDAGCRP